MQPDAAELARASAILNRAGVRLMQLDGVNIIGVWSDLDGPKVRAALGVCGSDRLPVRYLDGAAVPMRYKVRRVEGEPVPRDVLLEMERSPREPWKVRDRMLQEMGWGLSARSWVEWKAAQLNRLFQEQGVTGRPGRITAKTIRHGERKSEEHARKQSGEPGRLGTRLDVAGGVRLPPDGVSGPPTEPEAAACLSARFPLRQA